MQHFPLQNTRIFTKNARLFGSYKGRLVFAVDPDSEQVEDSEGVVYPFYGYGRVVNFVGTWNGMMVLNTTTGCIGLDYNTSGSGTVYTIFGPYRCRAVWGEYLISLLGDDMGIWRLDDTPKPNIFQLRLVLVSRYPLIGLSSHSLSVILGLEDCLLIGLYDGNILEYRHDPSSSDTRCQTLGRKFSSMVASIVDWKGCVFSGHEVGTVNVWRKQSGWILLQSLSIGGFLNVCNDELISKSHPNTSDYRAWSICTWNPTLHCMFSRSVRRTIRAFVVFCFRCTKLVPDIIFLISSMIAGTFPALSLRRRVIPVIKLNSNIVVNKYRANFNFCPGSHWRS